MNRLAAMCILTLASTARADDPRAYFAPDVRLVMSLNAKQMAAAPLAKGDGPAHDFVAGLQKTCAPFGIDAAKHLDRIWFVCGEDYPKGTLLFLQGKYRSEERRVGKVWEVAM